MAEITVQETQVQVRFKTETEFGLFQDALYYPPEVFATKSEVDLEAEGQARADAWVEHIKNPPVIPPDPEFKEREIARLTQVIKELEEYKRIGIDRQIMQTKEELENVKVMPDG